MLLKDAVKQTFEKFPELIDYVNTNQFDKFYDALADHVNYAMVHHFTLTLYSAGIDPLKHMTSVPPYFLYSAGYDDVLLYMGEQLSGRYHTLKLPDNIKTIGVGAFGYCSYIHDYKLPLYLTNIAKNAFYDCDATVFYIPKTVTHISMGAFGNNYEKIILNYEGSSEEFIEKVDNAIDLIDSNKLIIDYRG